MENQTVRLILASSSVYRKQMLSRFRLPFECHSPNVDETPHLNEKPEDLALRLSVLKAQAILEKHPNAIVIGSDQVATINGEAIGKPGNFERAFEQLKMLSGQRVEFHSALTVTDGDQSMSKDVITVCKFRCLSDDEITHYLNLEQPFDTAGSAKAESLGITLMESMHSDDPTAIIGLPLIELSRMLRKFGLNPTLNAL